jgi:hypothetical protein
MTRLCLILATALSFALVPAANATQRVKHGRYVTNVYGEPNLPIENALRWGYSQGYSNYPSGFGGLYGDGRYPGNTVSNPHSYNTLR